MTYADEVDLNHIGCRERLWQSSAIEHSVNRSTNGSDGLFNSRYIPEIELGERGQTYRGFLDIDTVDFGPQPDQFARASFTHSGKASRNDYTFIFV